MNKIAIWAILAWLFLASFLLIKGNSRPAPRFSLHKFVYADTVQYLKLEERSGKTWAWSFESPSWILIDDANEGSLTWKGLILKKHEMLSGSIGIDPKTGRRLVNKNGYWVAEDEAS